ncbi:MAG: GNAT family N-acetyltransferase, partial [Anaerolineaceae bacterium]|nr:GNAT family N-acetyltransferase [Anaerolineaceae bacterium]
ASRVMRRAFPPLQTLFFSWGAQNLVAEMGGKIVGAIVLKEIEVGDNRKAGFVSWVFTDPDVRGSGAGQALLDAAIKIFDRDGCSSVMACVEGFNTSSSKLFASRECEILSPLQQARLFGIHFPVVWIKMFHIMDIGHFVWARPVPAQTVSSFASWIFSLLANILVMLLVSYGANGYLPLAGFAYYQIPLAVLITFGLRSGAMLLAARMQGLKVVFRPWESGFPLSFLIAAIFFSFFPMPGSFYPKSHQWTSRDALPLLAKTALAGIVSVLLLCWGLLMFLRNADYSPELGGFLTLLLSTASPLLLFDTLCAFFPFASFNGRRVWDWNKWVWLVVAGVTAVLLFV